jgi:hypothetical protein
MFVTLVSAAMLATSAPVPKDDHVMDLIKVGERFGRLEVMMTWARTIAAKDDWTKERLGKMEMLLAEGKTAARQGKISRRQVDALRTLEVATVGLLELYLAPRGELTKSFRDMKAQLEKEWEIEKK